MCKKWKKKLLQIRKKVKAKVDELFKLKKEVVEIGKKPEVIEAEFKEKKPKKPAKKKKLAKKKPKKKAKKKIQQIFLDFFLAFLISFGFPLLPIILKPDNINIITAIPPEMLYNHVRRN